MRENKTSQMGDSQFSRKNLRVNNPQNNFGRYLNANKKTTQQTQSSMGVPPNATSTHFQSNQPSQSANKQKILKLLSGKISIVWVFLCRNEIDPQIKQRITVLYHDFSENHEYVVPHYSSYSQMEPFFQLEGVVLKVVSDLSNINSVVSHIHSLISQIYIYNQDGIRGMTKAIEIKRQYSKVKGIFRDLNQIIDRAEEDIGNEVRLSKRVSGSLRMKRQKILPSFMKLSGVDKSKATFYRNNLYSARTLNRNERVHKFYLFYELVSQKYNGEESQMNNLIQYNNIDHTNDIDCEQARLILRFYTKETFYYKTLNSMLRTTMSVKQFQNIALPFYQMYNSIRFYYNRNLRNSKRRIPKMTLYRGARLRQSERNKLTYGSFIQIFGFMSSSRNSQKARNFTDINGNIFIIKIPEMQIQEGWKMLDHGFVDLNQQNVSDYPQEQQVLINALNVFKVVEKSNIGGMNTVTLQYGAIFKLMKQKRNSLSIPERDVLINYEYCLELLKKTKNQGDAYFNANELEEAEQCYLQKVREQENKTNFLNLAEIQQKKGKLKQAEENVVNCYNLNEEVLGENTREAALNTLAVHNQMFEIKLEKEDFLSAEQQLNKMINILPFDEISFDKASLYRKRGEVRLKKGEIFKAKQDFDRGQEIYEKLLKILDGDHFSIKFDYVIKFATLWARDITMQQLDERYQQQNKVLQEQKRSIQKAKERIFEERQKINTSIMKLTKYVKDEVMYEENLKKGKLILLQRAKLQTNDPYKKAEIASMQALLHDRADFVQSENKMKQAIQLIENQNPMDEKVAQYSEKLAEIQKIQLQSKKKGIFGVKSDGKIIYSEQQHNRKHEQCINNYRKAINILKYNKNKKDKIMKVQNNLADLQLEESKFQQTEKIIVQTQRQYENFQLIHSQVARTLLILAKLSLARGQLKFCLQKSSQSLNKLRRSLVGHNNQEKELKIYNQHDIYLQAKLLQGKAYLKQLKHDCSLKSLEIAQQNLKFKFNGREGSDLLPQIYEAFGEFYASREQTKFDFDNYFQEAIKLRNNQVGKKNLQNGKTLLSYASYLLSFGVLKKAQKKFQQALQIYSQYEGTHPKTWIIDYTNSLFSQFREQKQEASKFLKTSLKYAQSNLDKTDIKLFKIQVEYARAIKEINTKVFLDIMSQVEQRLDKNIRKSNQRCQLSLFYDDQKISFQHQAYRLFQGYYKQMITRQVKIDSSRNSKQNYTRKRNSLLQSYRLPLPQ